MVVSTPGRYDGGVIQYDFGRMVAEGDFVRTGILNPPPTVFLTAINALRAKHYSGEIQLADDLSAMNPKLKPKYAYPGAENDILFEAEYDHVSGDRNCDQRDKNKAISRPDRDGTEPVIHNGTIASSNQVMRHGGTRERLTQESWVLSFEMEAAGLMNYFPCLVIRGICDYADTHKNKQ